MKAAVAGNRAVRAQSVGIVAAAAATMTPHERPGAAPPTPTRDWRRTRRDLPNVPPALPPPRGLPHPPGPHVDRLLPVPVVDLDCSRLGGGAAGDVCREHRSHRRDEAELEPRSGPLVADLLHPLPRVRPQLRGVPRVRRIPLPGPEPAVDLCVAISRRRAL